MQKEYIFFNGKRVARRDLSDGSVKYYFSDHLGSASIITNAVGAMPPLEESDYYPYGGEIGISTTDPNTYKFSGKERDVESGLDYFGARFYSSALGRFETVDTGAPHFSNPQSLNRYTYTANNPLRYVDPNGQDWRDAVKQTLQAVQKGAQVVGQGYVTAGQGVVQAYSTAINGAMRGLSENPKFSFSNVSKTDLNNIGKNLTLVVAGEVGAMGEVGIAGRATKGATGLSDSALVVRGGLPTVENLTKSAETISSEGRLSGISVNSADGASLEDLSQGIKNKKVGVTTVGEVREIGGDVIRDPLPDNPNHCLMCNVDAQEASDRLGVQKNPRQATSAGGVQAVRSE